MTTATLIMLVIGLAALIGGLALLWSSRRGSEGQRYARRIAGTMIAALGATLTLFAGEFSNA